MFKVNNKNTRTTSTYFTPFSSVFIVNFEQVNVSWIDQNLETLSKMNISFDFLLADIIQK